MWCINEGREPDNVIKNLFTAYLRKALDNTKRDYLLKSDKYRCSTETVDFQSHEWDAMVNKPVFCSEIYDLENGDELLAEALCELNERDRDILYARVFFEEDYKSVAKRLDISVANARFSFVQKSRFERNWEVSDEFY